MLQMIRQRIALGLFGIVVGCMVAFGVAFACEWDRSHLRYMIAIAASFGLSFALFPGAWIPRVCAALEALLYL